MSVSPPCEDEVVLTDERVGVRVSDVVALEAPMRALVGALDPDAVFVFDAPAMWTAFDVLVRLGESAKTLLARRVADASTWQREGYRSAAEQLAAVSGSSVSAARSALETSQEVKALPATAAAMRAGQLSPAKAAVIASAATVAPESEGGLLAGAGAPLAVVRDKCLEAKAKDRNAAHKRIKKGRYAREFKDKEGAWNFVARGTPEAGAEFGVGFNPIVDEMFKAARAEGREEPREAYAFDALIEMARRAKELAATGETAGETAPAPATGAAKPKKPSPTYMALLHLDVEALRRGEVEGDEICEIPGLGPIPVSVARELLGDAVLKLVITKGVDVINVTHLGRSPTVAQQVALWWQSPICTAEGCTRSRRLENDHEIGWAETHRTVLGELDPLCTHEHRLKTVYGWALVAGTGKRAFVPPDDPRHPKYRAPPDP